MLGEYHTDDHLKVFRLVEDAIWVAQETGRMMSQTPKGRSRE